MTYFDLSKVASAIENSAALCGETKIVTIDGPAGSGKTTLATELASQFSKTFGEVSVIAPSENTQFSLRVADCVASVKNNFFPEIAYSPGLYTRMLPNA